LIVRERITLFVGEHDWHQFHNPKDPAAAIAIEELALMELFPSVLDWTLEICV